jgi:choline-phosphate cytidylyltransferase
VGIIKLGIIGYGRIANRFIVESKYVSGVNVEGVYGLNSESIAKFALTNELSFYETDLEKFFERVDAVYIASPHLTHYDYIVQALNHGKHVLCEKPLVLSKAQAEEVYQLAISKELVLMEAVKTAYCPGFVRLISVAKSGLIGSIKSIDATFTKLVSGQLREIKKETAGGSVTELATYPLLAIVKLLGSEVVEQRFTSFTDEQGVDLFTKIDLRYDNAIASAKVGLGVKSEGDLVIAGTKGYIYVPAPWWKTEYFELRFEDMSKNKKYFYKFEDDGLRYELAEFALAINSKTTDSYKYTNQESTLICGVIEDFLAGKDIFEI